MASPRLIIDARPRGPHGPLALELILGRPVLLHLLDAAADADAGPVTIHARAEEHGPLLGLIPESARAGCRFVAGPPLEGAAVVRTDRLYDSGRLKRALRRRRDPESAVLWRLDDPAHLDRAGDELLRRRTYQPLGRFWALAPARLLAHSLRHTLVRPNAITLASAGALFTAAVVVAAGHASLAARLMTACLLALALILDTADGHLARLQGTASAFGRWLDVVLDETGDVALHAAVAWAVYARTAHPVWLLAGMFYTAGKYLFSVSANAVSSEPTAPNVPSSAPSGWRSVVHAIGHADVRWHAWIVLAAIGRLEWALVAYAAYYPARTLAGAWWRAAHRA
jgi:phosphatidylglycerophosphate synthase